MKLVSYFQTHNLGCPQYQYLKNGNETIAQVTIPGDRVLTGKPCKNKEEASESAAREALKYLVNTPGTDLSPSKPVPKPKSPKTFPTPPRQWYYKKAPAERVIVNSVSRTRF